LQAVLLPRGQFRLKHGNYRTELVLMRSRQTALPNEVHKAHYIVPYLVPDRLKASPKDVSMISLASLHDATLENVNLDWARGVVHLTLKMMMPGFSGAVIEAKDVTELKCPRLLPWGPSNSVNSVALDALGDGRRVTVEMQSGDVIEVRCQDVEVKPAPE
jgi:hypothetical protein